MNFKSVMIAAAALAAPAAGASAQGYYGYEPPPPPYAYAGESVAAPACSDNGFTILGAHAGVTVLGFGLNGGARFTAPADCGGYGYGYGEGAPRFEPRPYAAPAYAEPAYPPQPAYGYQGYGYAGWDQPSYGYAQPCGCEARGW